MKKNIVWVTLILLITIVLSFLMIAKKDETTLNKSDVKIVYKKKVQELHSIGIIKPVNTVTVGSTVSGLMKEIFVDYNSVVKAGQLIAKMDTSTFQADVDNTYGDLLTKHANLSKMQAITENDRKTYIRCKNLVQKNFMAKSELDLAESKYKSDLAEIDAVNAQIKQAEAAHEKAKYLLSFAFIKSPIDGIVIERRISAGQPVAASFQAPELFVIAKDLKNMQIQLTIPEDVVGKIKEGQKVEYYINGENKKRVEATVSQIRVLPNISENKTTYTVLINIKNTAMTIKPGMSANVIIYLT